MSKGKYKIQNWSEYNRGLKQRGSLTIWISEEVLEHWHYQGRQKRGGKRLYSDVAIETCLMVRQVYHLALRQTEGFVRSFFQLLSLPLTVPDYTTLCRRCSGLHLPIQLPKNKGIRDVVLDSTGLKLYGEGEWKVRTHGWSYHRSWRKLHVALNREDQQAAAVVLSENSLTDAMVVKPLLKQIPGIIDTLIADGAYDKVKVREYLFERSLLQGEELLAILSLKHNAILDKTGRACLIQRDEDLRAIKRIGRENWKITTNYHQRSKAETFMMRYKTIIGGKLKARSLKNQQTEAIASCKILNVMLVLAKPISEKVA
jgi:hypothetical protein